MKNFLITIVLVYSTFSGNAQDFRKACWGETPEQVMKKETLALVNKIVNYKMLHLNYVEFTEGEVYYTYTYMFYNDKLIGVKTKTAYLTKDNSRPNAEQLYHQAYQNYLQKYKELKEVVENNTPKFNIATKDKKIFVEMKKEDDQYFLVESVLATKKS